MTTSSRRLCCALLLGCGLSFFNRDAAEACPPVQPALETIATFDSSRFEVPESIAIDRLGNRYISLAVTGEIRQITPSGVASAFAVLPLAAPPLTPCNGYIGIMGALAIDHHDNLYVAVDSCDVSKRGVWKVSPQGNAQLLANLPAEALGNGIAFRNGQLYVADANQGLVWRVPADGSGPATIWADDPLLKPSVGHVFPGPNGAQFFGDELYIANSDQGTIVAFHLNWDGSAGPARVHATGIPCDDFAFDVFGNLYCTTDPFNTLVRVSPKGSLEVLLTAADGLDGPTSALFGRQKGEQFDLYITNGAPPGMSTTFHPSLMKLHLGIPGAPRS